MSTIVRIDLLVTHRVWCPTCQADTAHTTTGIGSRKGTAFIRDYAVTTCPPCGGVWSDHRELTLPPGHPDHAPA